MKPKPMPDSQTLKARPTGTVGARSPYPSVKNVSPLRYKDVHRVGGPFSVPIGAPSAQWKKPNDRIKENTHSVNSPSNESGPKMLKKCCRTPRRGNRFATCHQTSQSPR